MRQSSTRWRFLPRAGWGGRFFGGRRIGEGGESDSRTERQQGAFRATRTSGDADSATVMDESVRKIDPLFGGEQLLEVPFDFFGGLMSGESEEVGNAPDMGIDDDTAGNSEGGPEDDVGCFASDPWESGQFFKSAGNLSTMLCDECGSHSPDIGGFGPEEAEGVDDVLDILLGSIGELLRRGVFFEEAGSDGVDAFVGALGGENGGDGQLEGVFVDQGAFRRGIVPLERAGDLQRPPGGFLAGGRTFFRGHRVVPVKSRKVKVSDTESRGVFAAGSEFFAGSFSGFSGLFAFPETAFGGQMR